MTPTFQVRPDVAAAAFVPRATLGRVSQTTLIRIRWIAVAGQVLTILFVHYGLGFEVPLEAALGISATSALLNLAATAQGRVRIRLGERDTALYLGYDLIQLSALLYLTGGLFNPFSVLLLAPLTVSATLLSARSTIVLTLLASLLVTLLTIWHWPLPGLPQLPIDAYHGVGVWTGMVIAIAFIGAYVWRVSAEARQMADALSATQMALAREQRLSAVGGLAAAAAHQLGTPLGTIALIAKEMRSDLPKDGPMREDVDLLVQEVGRCRDILTELARRPAQDSGDPFESMTLPALVNAAAAAYLDPLGRIDISRSEGPPGTTLLMRRTPELIHGLGNLIHNALQFAHDRVGVTYDYRPNEVTLTIADDGPGFPPGLLARLGEPYVSGRSEESDHMGLGIFIASALLEHVGARLSFENAEEGGAVVAITWPRHGFIVKTSVKT